MTVLKAGMRLRSRTCATEVIVVRASAEDVELRCGGQPMSSEVVDGSKEALAPDHGNGTQLGKRYGSADLGLELLCTKAGEGSLSVGDDALPLKDAKPLPSSD
jgi:hypothetical protein